MDAQLDAKILRGACRMKAIKIGSIMAGLALLAYVVTHTGFKTYELEKIGLSKAVERVKDAAHPPVEKTKTWCALQCGEVPFLGFNCIMVCVTCTTEWGGGCQIRIFP